MTAIVDMFVDEIVNIAADTKRDGNPAAVAIAAVVQKAYVHFKAIAGGDNRVVGILLTELSDSLRLAMDSGTHPEATSDLIRSGLVLVGIYLSGLLVTNRGAMNS
ncbi:hypothetical protein [Cupriavidus alkaliphilus]|uniref:hypothetical protein n=1 Tax=Cupriavidus alkaliphilus TaxID=942866 RepID=UPI00339D6A52